MISVRPATAGDAAAMSGVLIASITELCTADHGGDPAAIAAWTANKSVEGVLAMLGNPRMRMFVAERNGMIAAVGAVSAAGEIGLNYVAPEARFAGVSKAMLLRLETELAGMGFSEIFLEGTETARRFYEGAGWVLLGPRTTGRRVNGYPMSKRLQVA